MVGISSWRFKLRAQVERYYDEEDGRIWIVSIDVPEKLMPGGKGNAKVVSGCKFSTWISSWSEKLTRLDNVVLIEKLDSGWKITFIANLTGEVSTWIMNFWRLQVEPKVGEKDGEEGMERCRSADQEEIGRRVEESQDPSQQDQEGSLHFQSDESQVRRKTTII